MDAILSARSTNMADAFTMLLAIQQGPKGPESGRIHKRMMTHNQNPFMQFIFHQKDAEGEKYHPVRWASVEFRQWDGFFYVYTNTTEEIKPFLPKKIGLKDIQQGFNYERFTRDTTAQIYTIYQIESAARQALGYLINGDSIPMKTSAETQSVLRRIMDFKNFHKTAGRVLLNISDLGNLLEK